MDYYLMHKKEVLKDLKSDANHGLTEKEVQKRQVQFGKNIIKVENSISPLKIFIDQFKSVLIGILIVAAIVSYFFGGNGHGGSVDTILILIIVVFNAIFGFIQDYKAEKSMKALKNMSVSMALIMRDGVLRKIVSEDIVPGDIVYLSEGAKIPADIRLLESNELEVDESILTGESVGSTKQTGVLKKIVGVADRDNMVYMDTVIIRGNGYGIAVRTGKETEVGHIAQSISSSKQEPTIFEKELQRLGSKIGIIILVLIAIVAIFQLIIGVGTWVDILLAAVSLGVAAIPEGLPAVVTLSMALGTRVMLKKNALVRKLTVVEGLGTADIICTDKTGTLTENMMTVKKVWFNKEFLSVTGRGTNPKGQFLKGKEYIHKSFLKPLLEIGLNCNDAKKGKKGYLGDPTEIALIISAEKGDLNERYKRIAEIPFSSDTKVMFTEHDINGKQKAFLKGAPEEVIKRCSHILIQGKVKKIDSRLKKEILKANRSMANEALRVLGFAYKKITKNLEKESEDGFVFVGLQGMIDPPRKGVSEAIQACHDAGITVKMITGDNLITARAIAKEVGIPGEGIVGSELDNMTPQELREKVEKIGIFARVAPKHKVMILRALKENGHNTVMTGDGVNDAPALKIADVGVGMGIRGSDLAKGVSDMVLLDDNFITIKEAIKEGRTIFLNIRKFVNYLLSSNIGEVLTVFIISLFGYLPLTAVQLLWINLLTDGFPALALGADPSPKGIMKQRPLKKGEGIINKDLLTNIVFVGIVLTVLVSVLFFIGLRTSKEMAMTLAFTGLVTYEMLRIIIIRANEKMPLFNNKLLVFAVMTSLVLQLVVLYTPLNKFFNAVPLGLIPWLWILGLGIAGTGFILYFSKVLQKDKDELE